MRGVVRAAVLGVILAVACGPPGSFEDGLGVWGGTEAARSEARAVFQAFARDVAPREVGVDSIEFVEFAPGYGLWDPVTRTVRIDETIDLQNVQWAVRRQLCFAVADQIAATEGGLPEAYAHRELTDAIELPMVAPDHDVFARLCGLGPWIAYVLEGIGTEACYARESAIGDVFRDLSQRVWQGYDRPPILGRPSAAVARLVTPNRVREVSAFSRVDPETFAAVWSGPNKVGRSALLDVSTGEILEEVDFPDPPSEPPEGELRDERPETWLVQEVVPWITPPTGGVLIWAELWLPEPWRVLPVRLYGEGDEWIRPATACGSGLQSGDGYFMAQEQLMEAIPVEGGFAWYHVGPVEAP